MVSYLLGNQVQLSLDLLQIPNAFYLFGEKGESNPEYKEFLAIIMQQIINSRFIESLKFKIDLENDKDYFSFN